ncbi:hypothetical protein BU23DRAFT_598140 [Bimuria novae-zelandiae CBS 107.79]|uniref:C2H2-type domain-containing protein n=1 Tax=Bimuria novae-zelandiae CBS 107.79 TaxID=1447943 RepID=A0A6A5VIG3_9PLEO|nr:hypothetical protein BU23DRAFT_598140 [Bimuria novae-zelandiae CBS 107.79]
MPPPRFRRPLRPWHPPRTSVRARWISNGPSDKNQEGHDDGALGGGEPAQPTTEVNKEAGTKSSPSEDAPATGWWGDVVASVSALLSRPPVVPSSTDNRPPKVHVATENKETHAPYVGRTSTPSLLPSKPSFGTTCLVCQETFKTTAKLRIHIYKRGHIDSWPAAFRNREEVEDIVGRRSSQDAQLGDGWGTGLASTYKKGQGRFCNECHTPLSGTTSRIQHMMSNEACCEGTTSKSVGFACFECTKSFHSAEQARQHVKSSPACLPHMRMRHAELPDVPLLTLAEKQYRGYLALLIRIHSTLKDSSSSHATPILHSILDYLRPIYQQAKLSEEHPILAYFGRHPQLLKKLQGPKSPTPLQDRAKESYHTSIRVFLSIYSDLEDLPSAVAFPIKRIIFEQVRRLYQDAKLCGSSGLPIRSLLGLHPGIYKDLKKSDQKVNRSTNASAHESNLTRPNSRKADESRTSALGGQNERTNGEPPITYTYFPIPSSKPSLNIAKHLTETANAAPKVRKFLTEKGSHLPNTVKSTASENSSSLKEGRGLHPSTTAKSTTTEHSSPLEKARAAMEKERPTESSTNQESDNADLKLQLQQLIDQVRLLQEKIAALPTSSITIQDPEPEKAASCSDVDAKPVTNLSIMDASETAVTDSRPTSELKEASASSAVSQTSSEVLAQPSTTPASSKSIDERSVSALRRRYEPKLQAQLRNDRLKASLANEKTPRESANMPPPLDTLPLFDKAVDSNMDGQRLVRQIHTQARSLKSSGDLDTNKTSGSLPMRGSVSQAVNEPSPMPAAPARGEMSDQSLLDELFPEASNYIQPHYTKRNHYPKLDPPSSTPLIRTYNPKEKLTKREKYIQAFQNSTDNLTALQLLHCSTELTEADFRRLVPKGQHIEGWALDGDFHQVIPGRDPLSLDRLPFYYLIFKNPDAALRYQSNTFRLHQLSKLHGPTSPMSAIPAPPGLLENGEDPNAAVSSYLLTPTSQDLHLNMVMQPYNPSLARLIEQGGYKPIVPNTTPTGKQIHKVLLYIEGYEPSPYDIYQLLMQDAAKRGLVWPFLHEHQSIHRLRDIIDLKTRFLPVSSANPWAASRKETHRASHDPYASFLGHDGTGDDDDDEGRDAKAMNQIIMNRVYNRWIIDFSEEEGARRFARVWHRKVLPMQHSVKHRTWRDLEEVRMCNAEYLW